MLGRTISGESSLVFPQSKVLLLTRYTKAFKPLQNEQPELRITEIEYVYLDRKYSHFSSLIFSFDALK
jgi:hypothetical protein